jgi:putative hydrolase of the HAD superfamily
VSTLPPEPTEDLREELIARIRRLSAPLTPVPTEAPPRPARLPHIRAVLFDVYGTLFISGSGDIGVAGPQHDASALVEAFREAGLGALSPGEAETALGRLRHHIEADHAAKRAAGAVKPEVEIRDIWRRVLGDLAGAGARPAEPDAEALARLAVAFECRVNPVWPMPNARETLRALAGSGLVLGIVSNAQFHTPLLFPALMEAETAELGFEEEACAWSWRIEAAKPDVRLFDGPLRTLATTRGIQPAEVVYVGNDCLNDVWTAREAGCRTALFAGDRRSLRLREEEPRCRDLAPDCVLTGLAQLPACLG